MHVVDGDEGSDEGRPGSILAQSSQSLMSPGEAGEGGGGGEAVDECESRGPSRALLTMGPVPEFCLVCIGNGLDEVRRDPSRRHEILPELEVVVEEGDHVTGKRGKRPG